MTPIPLKNKKNMKYDVFVTNEYAFVLDKKSEKNTKEVDKSGNLVDSKQIRVLALVPLDLKKYPVYETAAILPDLHNVKEFLDGEIPKKFNKTGEFKTKEVEGYTFWEGEWIF